MIKGVKQHGSHEERLTDKVWKFYLLVRSPLVFWRVCVVFDYICNQDILSFSLPYFCSWSVKRDSSKTKFSSWNIHTEIWLELKLGRCLGQIMMSKSIRCCPSYIRNIRNHQFWTSGACLYSTQKACGRVNWNGLCSCSWHPRYLIFPWFSLLILQIQFFICYYCRPKMMIISRTATCLSLYTNQVQEQRCLTIIVQSYMFNNSLTIKIIHACMAGWRWEHKSVHINLLF